MAVIPVVEGHLWVRILGKEAIAAGWWPKKGSQGPQEVNSKAQLESECPA